MQPTDAPLLCPAAWYNTWPSHFKEVCLHASPWDTLLFCVPQTTCLKRTKHAPAQVECFQQQVEPILYAAGVDMVYTGHTHAYEVCCCICWCDSDLVFVGC